MEITRKLPILFCSTLHNRPVPTKSPDWAGAEVHLPEGNKPLLAQRARLRCPL